MQGLLVNIGSNSSNPNGRGRIFEDLTFEYLPIPESEKTRRKVPTYRQLGFTKVRKPDLPVHVDPTFSSFTYGHIKRGFGDIQNLLNLRKDDILFFHSTLDNGKCWSTCIIGYFRVSKIHDCRKLTDNEILALEEFADNAHLKRIHPYVDLLVKGGHGSRLLKRALPLSSCDNPLSLRRSLKDIVCTVTGKEIISGVPWFRWIIKCEDPAELLRMMDDH